MLLIQCSKLMLRLTISLAADHNYDYATIALKVTGLTSQEALVCKLMNNLIVHPSN